jgi:hypothetical protein
MIYDAGINPLTKPFGGLRVGPLREINRNR